VNTLSKKEPAPVAAVLAEPRAGDVVGEDRARWLVLPSVLGGLRRELVSDRSASNDLVLGSRRQIDTVTGYRYLIVDAGTPEQRVHQYSRPRFGRPPAPLGGERGQARPRSAWWLAGLPVTRKSAPFLEDIDESTPAPWTSALLADVELVGMMAHLDGLQRELVGATDGVVITQLRERIPALDRIIDGLLMKARSAWINAHDGPELEMIADLRKMWLACWWRTRDGSTGQAQVFAAQAFLIHRDAAGWNDPVTEMANIEEKLRECGEPPPVPPADIPSIPRSLDEAVAAAVRGGE
jgi:hypothetical protein